MRRSTQFCWENLTDPTMVVRKESHPAATGAPVRFVRHRNPYLWCLFKVFIRHKDQATICLNGDIALSLHLNLKSFGAVFQTSQIAGGKKKHSEIPHHLSLSLKVAKKSSQQNPSPWIFSRNFFCPRSADSWSNQVADAVQRLVTPRPDVYHGREVVLWTLKLTRLPFFPTIMEVDKKP